MWRWLSAIALALEFTHAIAAPSSLGPTSAKEAEILWKDGRAAFEKRRYQDAIQPLTRLIDRYPGYPGYLESQKMLGISLVETGDAERALPYLHNYIEGVHKPVSAAQGKLALGDAYLALHRFSEAFLLSKELEKGGKGAYSLGKTLEGEALIRGEGLILKARALIGLDQDERAGMALDSAEITLRGNETTSLNGRVFETRLLLKTRACAKFPTLDPLDERQTRDQIDRRGSCLQEALLDYRKTLPRIDENSAKSSSEMLRIAFSSFARACKEPPSPPPLSPKDRTEAQLKRYKTELAEALRGDCRRVFENAATLLILPEGSKPSPESERSTELARAIRKVGQENFSK